MGSCPIASEDASKHENLASLFYGLVWLQKARPHNLWTMETCGFGEAIHQVHLDLDVLEMVLKTLMLKKSEGAIALVDPKLENFSQSKSGAWKQNIEIGVSCGDFDLLNLEVEMIIW